MAITLAWRAAVALAPVAYRWAATGGSPPTQGFTLWMQEHWREFTDPSKSAIDIMNDLQAGLPEGSVVLMADTPAPFEMRKLQVRWSRAPSVGPVQDVDVCTFHFLKAPGGEPTDSWDTTDYTTIESAFNTYWGAIKGNFTSMCHLDQYRWYADGPAFYSLNSGGTAYVPNGDNPARRVTEVDVAGTGTGSPLPPQCSISVSEVTSSRRHWGRYYLPAAADAVVLGADGRINNPSPLTSLLSSAVTFYNACRAASLIPVVWSIQKPERPKKPTGTLPAVGAVAYEVTAIQVDDLFDVIRSRRYSTAINKPRTALT